MMEAFLKFTTQTSVIAEMELHKILREPTEIFTRAVQPVLWLVMFGGIFSHVRGIPIGNYSYQQYMAPGILAQSIMFSSIFYGIAVIWERDLGHTHKLLATPAYRTALVFGKSISSAFRGLAQALIIYLIAHLMQINIAMTPISIIGAGLAITLGSAVFSTFSFVIACLVKSRERFMGVGQLITMPLFFASNAIYPFEIMPSWLRTVARFNPLTYLVEALRAIMLNQNLDSQALALDLAILALTLLILLILAVRLYPLLIR